MRKNPVLIVLLFIFLNWFITLSYSQEDKKESKDSSKRVNIQPSRSIVPPAVVPSGSVGVSPTISPRISTPSLNSNAINMRVSPAMTPVSNTSIIPVQTIVPIVGNTIGEVTDIGKQDDGTMWLEVKDRLFDQSVKIKVKDRNVPIAKEAQVMSFEDIKIGDMVNVLFISDIEENKANFINILTEKEFGLMTGSGTKEEDSDSEPPGEQ